MNLAKAGMCDGRCHFKGQLDKTSTWANAD